ncbi:hypothetical protein GGX14DRAFT_573206 [Mycena pura]|uniref:Uncharacterized protein n=1 Tax=Mycena pura TaxID=153505 RepID=A0AAD6UZW6_9AGAR|nr:hypothetical protein GGX14DRAFT_573206 [Mycena pura]
MLGPTSDCSKQMERAPPCAMLARAARNAGARRPKMLAGAFLSRAFRKLARAARKRWRAPPGNAGARRRRPKMLARASRKAARAAQHAQNWRAPPGNGGARRPEMLARAAAARKCWRAPPEKRRALHSTPVNHCAKPRLQKIGARRPETVARAARKCWRAPPPPENVGARLPKSGARCTAQNWRAPPGNAGARRPKDDGARLPKTGARCTPVNHRAKPRLQKIGARRPKMLARAAGKFWSALLKNWRANDCPKSHGAQTENRRVLPDVRGPAKTVRAAD